jgi:hypothetical protein
MACFTFLSSSIWKWFFVNVLICYIPLKKPICDMIIIKLFKWLKNLFQPHGITYWMYVFLLFNILWRTFFCANIFWHHIIWNKKCSSLTFGFFVFWLTIICKNIVKFFFSIDMVKIQTRLSWKIIQCDNNFGPP